MPTRKIESRTTVSVHKSASRTLEPIAYLQNPDKESSEVVCCGFLIFRRSRAKYTSNELNAKADSEDNALN